MHVFSIRTVAILYYTYSSSCYSSIASAACGLPMQIMSHIQVSFFSGGLTLRQLMTSLLTSETRQRRCLIQSRLPATLNLTELEAIRKPSLHNGLHSWSFLFNLGKCYCQCWLNRHAIRSKAWFAWARHKKNQRPYLLFTDLGPARGPVDDGFRRCKTRALTRLLPAVAAQTRQQEYSWGFKMLSESLTFWSSSVCCGQLSALNGH